VPQHPPAPLEKLLALAQGYADFAIPNIGHVPPALLADSPIGVIQFVPDRLKDVRAKDNFANTARLICVAYEVTAAVLVLEAWMKQMLLPIIRTDAGGFFGFGDDDGPQLHNFEGRFAELLPSSPLLRLRSWPLGCWRRWGSQRSTCAAMLSGIERSW
jgi:hypothetical protein